MSMVDSPTAPSRWHGLLIWLAGAALAAPIGIVLHEAAHFLAAHVFGFEDPTLHFASSGYARSDEFWDALFTHSSQSAAAVYPVAHAGAIALAGVLLTWLVSLTAAFAAPRVGLRSFGGAFLAAFAMTAALRWLPGVIYLVAVRPRYPDARPNFDEFRASVALGIPVELLVLVGIAITAACLAYLLPKMAPRRWLKMAAVIVGFGAGVGLWMTIGPYLLP
ncbi:MAG: hypothetical protein ABI300_08515 [Rhodanobacter sp.]